jgi:peptidoglycan biosynthesis protein MviN/MurJ (putative lipid II flippase)
MQKARYVVNISWLSLLINVIFCIILMLFMSHTGIALASSISVFFQLFILHRYLKTLGIRIPREHKNQFKKMIVASAVMGVALLPFANLKLWEKGFTARSCTVLFMSVMCGIILYFGILWAMGMRGLPQRQREG